MFDMTGSGDPFGGGPEIPQNNFLRLVVERLAKMPIRFEVVRFDDGPDDVAVVVGRGDDQVLIVRENDTHTFMVASPEVQTSAIGEDAVALFAARFCGGLHLITGTFDPPGGT